MPLLNPVPKLKQNQPQVRSMTRRQWRRLRKRAAQADAAFLFIRNSLAGQWARHHGDKKCRDPKNKFGDKVRRKFRIS